MKPLLTSTALFLLVIGFSGVVSGQDTLVDFEETKRLAERGFAASQTLLGVMYYLGEGVPENKAEAARWYRLAAEQGDVNAQYELGTMYLNGEGVPENDAEAVKWYRLAAEQGNEGARGNSEEGENGGIEPSTRGFSVDSVTDSLIESMS
ncbi:MAG TPA: sel1 repeat family protein [Porticoccaceae bacterium]|jgi:TPR repeat protein|nr:sel1 repeat family protein [Porticoccaceae bacterium]